MFKFIFDLVTEPLGLPIEWYWEYLILAIIGAITYLIAYNKVGDMYSSGLISGNTSGSFFHWVIRTIYFVIIWAATYFIIWVGRLILANWQIILFISGSIIFTVMFCVLTITLMRYVRKRRTVTNNA